MTGDLNILTPRSSVLIPRRMSVHAYAAVMAEESERAIATWQSGQRRDIHSDMMRLTLQIVTRTLFGLDFSHGVEATERLIDAVMDEFNSRIASPFRFRYPLPSLRTLRLYRAMKELDEIAYTAIRERRQHPQQDLISMLVGATDEDGTPDSRPWSGDCLRPGRRRRRLRGAVSPARVAPGFSSLRARRPRSRRAFRRCWTIPRWRRAWGPARARPRWS